MSRPLLAFILLLLIPVAFRVYSTLQSVHTLQTTPIKHLAVIMDGNRRWAQKRNLVSSAGHQKGAQTIKKLIRYCLERKIEMVSVYAFSLENFQRSPEEIDTLFTIMVEESEAVLPELQKAGVKIRFIGDKEAFPQKVKASIEKLETETKNNTNLQLNILFCYGGRQEILSAVKHIIQDVKAGKLNSIPDEEAFKEYLWTKHDIPDPDLIIRTGGVKRLSNFLTYQTTYSELYFTDRLWPDLSTKDLDNALEEYQQRK